MRIRALPIAVTTAAAIALLTGAAAAAPSITISPTTPFTPGALTAGPPITRSPDPQLTVQAAGATSFGCVVDRRPLSCGSPTPGAQCQATLCTTIDLPMLRDGDHVFAVTAFDAQDGSSSQGSVAFDVHAGLPLTAPGHDDFARPRHPVFRVIADSGDPNVLDAAECSFTPARSRAVWSPCAPDRSNGAHVFAGSPALGAHSVAYRFQARAVDPFGRVDATPVTQIFDPVPCTVTAPHAIALSRLVRRGVTVTIACTGVRAARLRMYVQGTVGHRLSPTGAARGRPLSELAVHGSSAGFTARRTLRIARGGARRLPVGSGRNASSSVIAVQAVGAYATAQSGLPAYASVTARR